MQNQKTDNINNPQRLKEVLRLGLHADDAGRDLSDITREITQKLNMPVSAISIVLDQAQYFISQHGMEGWVAEAQGTPVEWAFCANVVQTEKPFIVENATENAIMKDSPLVTQEGTRCYIGIPLTTSEGQVVGSICALDTEERTFTEEEVETMKEFSQEIMNRLEARAADKNKN